VLPLEFCDNSAQAMQNPVEPLGLAHFLGLGAMVQRRLRGQKRVVPVIHPVNPTCDHVPTFGE